MHNLYSLWNATKSSAGHLGLFQYRTNFMTPKCPAMLCKNLPDSHPPSYTKTIEFNGCNFFIKTSGIEGQFGEACLHLLIFAFICKDSFQTFSFMLAFTLGMLVFCYREESFLSFKHGRTKTGRTETRSPKWYMMAMDGYCGLAMLIGRLLIKVCSST